MNLKSPLRRTAVLTAGAMIGLSGAFALTGPASAHHPIFEPGAPCVNEDGTWQVSWTVGNSESHKEGTLTDVQLTPAGSSITNIKVGAILPMRGSDKPALQGVQTLGADDKVAQIGVSVQWPGAFKADTSKVIEKPTQKCKPTTPPTSTPPTPPTKPPATPTTPPTTTPPATTPPTTTPPATTPPTTTPPSDSPVTEPEFVYEPTCDSVTVGIVVPKDWKDGDLTVVFKTSEGESKTVVGKVGKTTTVKFKAVDGMKITATPEGFEDEGATITYEQPEDCDTAGGGGGNEDEPSLPLTGAAAGSIAGGAALLLAAGVAMFFVARRRKVKFTA